MAFPIAALAGIGLLMDKIAGYFKDYKERKVAAKAAAAEKKALEAAQPKP